MPRTESPNRRSVLVGGLVAALVLLGGALLPTAAQAAPPRAITPADTVAAESIVETTDSTEVVDADAPDGSHCKTVSWGRQAVDAVTGARLASFTMHTHFCYNFTSVTSHSTWVTEDITTYGAINGWNYNGDSGITFNCYQAQGSTRPCSGNHEVDQGFFQACVAVLGCDESWNPIINMRENYKGEWFHDTTG